MSEQTRYFCLNDDIGRAPDYFTGPNGEPIENPNAGDLDPLIREGLMVQIPAMVKGNLLLETKVIELAPVDPGGRIVAAENPAIANALLQTGKYHEVDPPKSTQAHTPRKKKEQSR